MPKYEKLATDDNSVGGATVDVDWRKDDAIIKETKWAVS